MFPFNINISVFNVYGCVPYAKELHMQKSCIPVYAQKWKYDIFDQTLLYLYRLSHISFFIDKRLLNFSVLLLSSP